MNGLFELQVKDKIVIVTPETPELKTTRGAHIFMERFKGLVLLRGSANEEMWSKQETLGMCLDMWRHTKNYRRIINRWAAAVREGLQMETSSGFRNLQVAVFSKQNRGTSASRRI